MDKKVDLDTKEVVFQITEKDDVSAYFKQPFEYARIYKGPTGWNITLWHDHRICLQFEIDAEGMGIFSIDFMRLLDPKGNLYGK